MLCLKTEQFRACSKVSLQLSVRSAALMQRMHYEENVLLQLSYKRTSEKNFERMLKC